MCLFLKSTGEKDQGKHEAKKSARNLFANTDTTAAIHSLVVTHRLKNEVGSVGATLKLKQRRQIREGSLESGELERRWNWWEWVGSLVNSTFESELSSEERQGETPGRSAEEGFLTSRVHRLTRCSSKALKVVQDAQCLLGTPHLYH